MKTDKEELITKRVYELFERAGWPDGDGLKYWFEAAEDIEPNTIIGVEVLENSAVLGTPVKLHSQAIQTPKSAVGKQPDRAEPVKRRAISKTGGGKKRQTD